FYLPEKKIDKKPSIKLKTDNSLFKLYKGFFSSQEGGPLQILDSSELYVKFNLKPFLLTPLSDSSFDLFDGYAKVVFPGSTTKPATNFTFKTKDSEVLFARFEKPILSDVSRSTYVGTYESKELEVQYHIINDQGK